MWYESDLGDYELLDCSDGNRLERWGDYILIRPDPQVIWKGMRRHPAWDRADAAYTRSSKGGGGWGSHRLPEAWNCRIASLNFNVKPMGFKHTGVFPEQAANWRWIEGLCRRRRESGREVRVLNLFAYTGGASLAAAKGGASVCHVDAAKNMVAMAKENLKLSGLEDRPCRFLVDDALKFVRRELRRGNRYEGIVMDPPSYGRGPKGEMWHLEDSIHDLIRETAAILSDDPLFYLVNSYTTGLSGSAISYMVHEEVGRVHGGKISSDELGIMVQSTGKCLPCGFATRWERE
ncbi:MAG: class I SAM-dependent methyltransferase [Clostridia bacterium]|nr:class I SAM-dependent methyltransferase [Clostridia bacterium]